MSLLLPCRRPPNAKRSCFSPASSCSGQACAWCARLETRPKPTPRARRRCRVSWRRWIRQATHRLRDAAASSALEREVVGPNLILHEEWREMSTAFEQPKPTRRWSSTSMLPISATSNRCQRSGPYSRPGSSTIETRTGRSVRSKAFNACAAWVRHSRRHCVHG